MNLTIPFIEITNRRGSKILVNIAHIMTVDIRDNVTRLHIGALTPVIVLESYNEVKKLIIDAQSQ